MKSFITVPLLLVITFTTLVHGDDRLFLVDIPMPSVVRNASAPSGSSSSSPSTGSSSNSSPVIHIPSVDTPDIPTPNVNNTKASNTSASNTTKPTDNGATPTQTSTTITITLNLDAAGKVFYGIGETTVKTPSYLQLLLGNDGDNKALLASGNVDATAKTVSINVQSANLKAKTNYKVFYAPQTLDVANQANAVKTQNFNGKFAQMVKMFLGAFMIIFSLFAF